MSINFGIPNTFFNQSVIMPQTPIMPLNPFSQSIFSSIPYRINPVITPYTPMFSMMTIPTFQGFSLLNNFTNFINTGFKKVSNIFNGKKVKSAISKVKKCIYNKPKVSKQVQNNSFWTKLGYNAQKGQRLANEAAKGAAGGFIGKCATYVKRAISKAGLGKYISGANGKDIARVYGNNKNFKKISAQGIDVKKLPAGCILCYDAGKSGHHKVYGHTGISLGDGTEVSDGRTRNPKPCSYILIPV